MLIRVAMPNIVHLQLPSLLFLFHFNIGLFCVNFVKFRVMLPNKLLLQLKITPTPIYCISCVWRFRTAGVLCTKRTTHVPRTKNKRRSTHRSHFFALPARFDRMGRERESFREGFAVPSESLSDAQLKTTALQHCPALMSVPHANYL